MIDEQLGNDGFVTSKDRETVRKIRRAAEILVIQLRRTHMDPYSGQNYKLKNDVDFPEHLDLSAQTTNGRRLEYRLAGVAAHSGQRVDIGHWIAVVRAKAGDGFYTVNDLTFYDKAQDFNEMRHPSTGDTNFDPAVLVYVKTAGT